MTTDNNDDDDDANDGDNGVTEYDDERLTVHYFLCSRSQPGAKTEWLLIVLPGSATTMTKTRKSNINEH